MTVQFLEIAGLRMAVLPAADYEQLLEQVEDRVDSTAAAASEQRRLAGEPFLPAALVDRLLAGESPLRVWRSYRGMTQTDLAAAARVKQSRVSELENGEAHGKPTTWRALAQALSVSVDDILPSV